jgi:hypothetical protein
MVRISIPCHINISKLCTQDFLSLGAAVIPLDETLALWIPDRVGDILAAAIVAAPGVPPGPFGDHGLCPSITTLAGSIIATFLL